MTLALYLHLTNSTLQVYKAKGKKGGADLKKEFHFSENTVKGAKEVVLHKQQQKDLYGTKATLEIVNDSISDLKKEQLQLKNKLGGLETNVKTILEIMISRHGQPMVEHI